MRSGRMAPAWPGRFKTKRSPPSEIGGAPHEDAQGGQCRPGISRSARGPGRGLLPRECRDRLRDARRRLRAARGRGQARPASHGGPARVGGRGHGAWRLARHRTPAGGHGPRDGGHGERRLRHHHGGALAGAHPDERGAHADHRGGPAGHARPLHPLGAGELRPGRHAPRVREVGLRAPRPVAGRGGGGSRLRADAVGAARARLPHAAARGAGRAAAVARHRLARPPPGGRAAAAGSRRGSRKRRASSPTPAARSSWSRGPGAIPRRCPRWWRSRKRAASASSRWIRRT